MKVNFSKMHGLGNDFMVIDATTNKVSLNPTQIQKMSHRQLGVGFDQLLVLETSSKSNIHYHTRIYNADGSEVGHCGNGARAIALYLKTKELAKSWPIMIETSKTSLVLNVSDYGLCMVEMGVPTILNFDSRLNSIKQEFITIANNKYDFIGVDIGNPHAVFFVEDINGLSIEDFAKEVIKTSYFPQGVNVSLVQIKSKGEIELRVFERGVGATRACGSAACASVVAGIITDKLDKSVNVTMPGGSLLVSWDGQGQSVNMKGTATFVYDGELELESF